MANTKKPGGKKGAASGPTVVHKTELHFELDADKVAAIKKCLDNGKLSITLHQADLNPVGPESASRGQKPYLYD